MGPAGDAAPLRPALAIQGGALILLDAGTELLHDLPGGVFPEGQTP